MKKSLYEHIERMKFLSKYNGKRSINEDVQQQGGQQNPTQPQSQQAGIDPNFEKEMTAALGQIMQDLPNELADVAKSGGDRDGQLELTGDQQQANPNAPQQPQQPAPQQVQNEAELNEAIGMLAAGGVLALPAIVGMVGKAAQFLGKSIGHGDLNQWGEKTKNFAEKMHHSYEGVIDKILSPLTKNLDPAKRKTINKIVFYAIIATFFGLGASGAVGAAGAGKAGLAAAEGGLSGIKASELVAAAKEIIPKVLQSSGLVS